MSHCEVHSGVGRRKMLEALDYWMNTDGEIDVEYNAMEEVEISDSVKHELCGLQDIRGTIQRLAAGETMDDIQLFEIKHLTRIAKAINMFEIAEVLEILDPNHEDIDTFYIYDAYDGRLPELRRQYKADNDPETLAQVMEVEDEVRMKLSKSLQRFAEKLSETLEGLGMLDFRIAKLEMADALGLIRPEISANDWHFKALVNLEVREAITDRYQPIDIDFEANPTIITGMNMGGKTVLIKSIGMAQEMLQHGFLVPASEARMALVDRVLYSIDDNQSATDGLSSFAAEMTCIDNIITTITKCRNNLVLVDELARTTNPAEGRLIVNRVVRLLDGVPAFITTHYDGIEGDVRRLRVRGLNSSFEGDWRDAIDYRLVETTADEVPHEAFRVAKAMGIDWLEE